MSRAYPRGEEEVEVFVKQDLVGMVSEAEALQELVGQPHDLVHPNIIILQSELSY